MTSASDSTLFNFNSVPITGEGTSSLIQFEVSPGQDSAKTREP